LKNYQGALILVSHDRRLLDSLCTRTLALSRGNLESYAGNYSYYEQQAAARRVQTEQAAKNQQRRIEKTERFIERFRAKNTKAAQVQSRIKALEKIERIEVQQDEARIAFRFPPVARSGQTVLELEAISKNYGEHAVLKNISLKIERGERVAIAGFNGAGKSTLVRIMAGALGYDAGQLRLGHNVTLSYFAQHQAEELNPELTALQEAEAAAPPGQQQRARDLLGTFLLSGDDALKRVSVLSGGEKNRLALAKMLLKPFNFLILDEPTNHLDMRSKAVLQQAIQAFEGTLVIVSHDRDFIDPLVNKVIEVSPRGLRTFLGNVSDYAESVSLEKSQPPAGIRAAPKTKSQQGVLSAKERRSLSAQRQEFLKPYKKRLAALEEKISKLETEQTELEARMADEDFYKDQPQFAAALKRYDALKTELTQTYADWETTGQQLEQAQTQAQEHA